MLKRLIKKPFFYPILPRMWYYINSDTKGINKNIVGNQKMGKQMILDRSKDEGMSK